MYPHEFSYTHNLDDVIDSSDAVLAIGTEKVSTNVLKDRSLSGNDGTIHGAMPSSGYFLGRRFDGVDDYIDCGVMSEMDSSVITFECLVKINEPTTNNACIIGNIHNTVGGSFLGYFNGKLIMMISSTSFYCYSSVPLLQGTWCHAICTFDNSTPGTTSLQHSINGVNEASINKATDINQTTRSLTIGDGTLYSNMIGIIAFAKTYNNLIDYQSNFNTLARLPLYRYIFTDYPNNSTSLTTHLPNSTGRITSGTFNKTDGFKCTATGAFTLRNNHDFDGSEYITLTIGGVEYSGTGTITQGTITASISQGSNLITVSMTTGDVLEEINIQFREEV